MSRSVPPVQKVLPLWSKSMHWIWFSFSENIQSTRLGLFTAYFSVLLSSQSTKLECQKLKSLFIWNFSRATMTLHTPTCYLAIWVKPQYILSILKHQFIRALIMVYVGVLNYDFREDAQCIIKLRKTQMCTCANMPHRQLQLFGRQLHSHTSRPSRRQSWRSKHFGALGGTCRRP